MAKGSGKKSTRSTTSDPNQENFRLEQVTLCCLLEAPRLIAEIDFDLASDFLISDHRNIWRAMVALHGEGLEISDQTLLAARSKVELAIFVDILATAAVTANFSSYVRRLRELSRARRIQHLAEELTTADPADHPRIIEQLTDAQTETFGPGIRHFADIPEIQLLDIPPVDYIVPALGIARNTITLWSGEDGSGKTALAYAMAAAVSQGREFLGMVCQQTPVLYLDLENPSNVVQNYVRLHVGEVAIPQLRVWGTWNELSTPQYGNPQLLAIAKECRALVIVDPFRYFHDCDEDSSTEMTPVMKFLRACALCGGAVVVLHHPARSAEDGRGRGSTAIRAGSDLAFLHTLDKQTSTITLKVDKNRHGERRDFTIRADFAEATFEAVEATWAQHRKDEIAHLEELITKAPGISANELVKTMGTRRGRILSLLQEGLGTFWMQQPGPRRSKCFFPVNGRGSKADLFDESTGSPFQEPDGTTHH
jgi:hypothetical protein